MSCQGSIAPTRLAQRSGSVTRCFAIIGMPGAGAGLLGSALGTTPGLDWIGASDLDALHPSPGQIPGIAAGPETPPDTLARILADPECARFVVTRDAGERFGSIPQATGAEPDPEDIAAEQAREHAFLCGIRMAMQCAGMTAFELTHAELGDPEVIAGAIAHIGLPPQVVPTAFPLPHLAEEQKPSGTTAKPIAAGPSAPVRRLASTGQVVLGRERPLAFLPLPGAGLAAGIGGLERIDGHGKRAPGPVQSIEERLEAGEILAAGLSPSELAAARPGRLVFTLVCHPVTRLLALFAEQCFGGRACVEWVRRGMTTRFGQLPGYRALAEQRLPPEHDLLRHRDLFAGFLEMVESAFRHGQPGLDGVPAAWAPQVDWLASYAAFCPAERVLRLERFSGQIRALCREIGEPPPSPAGLASLAATAAPGPFAAAEIVDVAMEARIARIYAVDFEAFGFAPLPR